ncbi:MAG: hypothetical protein ACJ8FY_26300 [Gemmataceae bacterium]
MRNSYSFSSVFALCAGLIVLSLTNSLAAQPPPQQLTRLRVQPAAAPTPALKYKLLPELEDKTPGNAALLYLRAFSPEWYMHRRQPNYPGYLSNTNTPVSDFPKKDLSWLVAYNPLKQLDEAARKETCDWEMPARLREKGIGTLFPEVQGFRELAALLALRSRLHLANGDFDQAIASLQTGFSLGRDVGQAPTLINFLVGAAISQIMIKQLEDVIQQPKSPNLYWSLTYLPNPLLDLRKGFEGERLMLYATIPELKGIEKEQLSPEKEAKLLDELGNFINAGDGREVRETDHVTLTVMALKIYPEAKKALIAEGRKPDEVEAMPVLQVVVIQSLRRFREHQDELYKWLSVPFPEAKTGLDQADKRLRMALEKKDALPFYHMIPAVAKVYNAHANLARKIAALRCLEAIRLYAKENDGKPPAKLDDISQVPVPLDPLTGKSFQYQAVGQIITLFAAPPATEPPNASNSFTYEMTIES